MKKDKHIFSVYNFSENLLFYCTVIVGLIPLLTNKYFVTLDGAAHLYNGVLIKSLLAGNYPEINNIFQLNSFPVPNWIGHFLFAFFSTFLPGYLTEKTVLLLYLFFTPFIFRKLVLLLAPENRIFSYLMILFVHSQIFYFGFFNLSFGILFLFLTIYYYYKYCREVRIRQILILSGLFLLTYFSHIFTFMILLFILILISAGSIQTKRTGDGVVLSNIKKTFKNSLKILLASVPALILTILYLIKIDSVENASRPNLKELLDWIFCVRPILALGTGFPWKTYTYLLFLLFMVMLLTNVFLFIKNALSKKDNAVLFTGKIGFTSFIWFFVTLVFLFLYLLLPNAILLTERLILFYYLFFITWLAILKYPKWLHFAAIIVILTVHISFTRMYSNTMKGLSGEIELLKDATKDVEPGSLLLTLNYHDSWLHVHTTGYIGCDKPIAVLENYEAGLAWFPVRWNLNHYQIGFLNDWGIENKKVVCEKYINKESPLIFSLTGNDNRVKPIPYILITGNFEDESKNFPACAMEVLNTSYKVQQKNKFCTLYVLKENNL